jgi:hypothetical protein
MTDPFFDTSQESKSSNARTFDFMGPNPPKEKLQIFYDQLEKVYQRSKITKEDF